MRKLKFQEQALISGGQCSCKEALELNVVDWEWDLNNDITQFCTQDQFSVYALGMVDLLYNNDFNSLSWEAMDDAELTMIRHLNI